MKVAEVLPCLRWKEEGDWSVETMWGGGKGRLRLVETRGLEVEKNCRIAGESHPTGLDSGFWISLIIPRTPWPPRAPSAMSPFRIEPSVIRN